MKFLKHSFEWGYGYWIVSAVIGLACMPFMPASHAGNFMTATMLVNMSESEDISRRAMATGYVAAIHDEFSGKRIDDPTCFAVPQSVDLQEMAKRTIHFVDWFAHQMSGWPKDKDVMYPARELVQLGLIKHFPCEHI